MEDSPIIKDSLRHRATALASAFYYTECSLSGISSTNASAAEENVLYKQSKWWLHGDDPNHPAHLQDMIVKSDGEKAMATTVRSTDEVPEENPALIAHIDDQGDEEGRDNDWDAPIFAHDDDYPSSLPIGTLNSFQSNRKTSNGPFSTSSTLLPTWSQGPLDSSKSCAEDVLRSYSAYFCTSDKTPFSRSVAHPVTSESEADDSFCTSGMSRDESSASVRASVATSRHLNRGRHKRLRVSLDEDATLDEAFLQAKIDRAKKDLLSSLQDTTSKSFSESLKCLERAKRYNGSEDIEGTWIMTSPPDYPSCLGTNVDGDKIYTLERMSFGMYQPGALICSIQQQFNTISSVKNKAHMPQYVPSSLKKEVDDESGKCSGRMKTYNIIASFTIEAQDGHKALRGIMTNYAYTLPDPSVPGRLSIWFTGGTIEPADEDEESVRAWKKVFGFRQSDKRDKCEGPEGAEEARQMAQHILLGAVSKPMDEEGVIGFHLKRPIGGHSSAFCDIVYMDDDMRVMKGHSGSVYVFKRTAFD
ncbi:putative plastid-lipid-associated protein [Skeletonema marinoi]|uniref:Plastid-lipid-associated protein n=1 Tax=Skeletonema marinoi TaxID=267567 RepID=A0AAD8Y2S4_9STRA|nr:putative plastid-lipid-associated protein [Skeletonema marinoi]